MNGRIRIVGGGLTGIMAAFEAHRLGWRDIELHERFDALGGVARPKVVNGAEMRDGCVYFGPEGDALVERLKAQGAAFETFDNRFGSLSLDGAGKRVFTWDFGGPAVDCASLRIARPAGDSLADRIAAYPSPIAETLAEYCRWHLGADLSAVHGDAAIPLAINRVYPAGAETPALVALKASNEWADELYGVPRGLSGRTANVTASLPSGGFTALFETCRRALEALGVDIRFESLISPRQVMAEHAAGDTVVWAANPTPLFKPMGLSTPSLVKKSFFTYVFEADFDGPCPVYVQNFTAKGDCFRAYLYESGGKTLVVAECVREADLRALPGEIRGLLSGFGSLKTGALLHSGAQPRWIYHSRDAIAGLGQLRAKLTERFGSSFVCGAWEPYGKSAKLAEVDAALASARAAPAAGGLALVG